MKHITFVIFLFVHGALIVFGGWGQAIPHRTVDKDDEQIPTISIDYGFGGTLDSPANELPILVVSLE